MDSTSTSLLQFVDYVSPLFAPTFFYQSGDGRANSSHSGVYLVRRKEGKQNVGLRDLNLNPAIPLIMSAMGWPQLMKRTISI